MKANHFRIGNWLFHSDNTPMKIAKIESEKFAELNFNDCSIVLEHKGIYYESKIFPIPITEEILLKCGFEKGKCYFSLENFDIDLKGWFGFNNMVANANIKYLHQLQNLYFALTGEELEVNL
jgi:TATA-box binding protein (TBP) (component of TFIID and TFIIIB)